MIKSVKSRAKGFTLIELMIVVAIIGILAAIAIPKFAELLRKSNEGATKGNLGAIRSALTIYYSDTEGVYPTTSTLSDLTQNSRYLEVIPNSKVPPHHGGGTSAAVAAFDPPTGTSTDANGWGYNDDSTSRFWGTVVVNCTHTDSRTVTWTRY